MVEDFLKLCCRLFALMGGKIGFSSDIHGIQIRPIVKAIRWQTKLIRSRSLKRIKRLLESGVASCRGDLAGSLVSGRMVRNITRPCSTLHRLGNRMTSRVVWHCFSVDETCTSIWARLADCGALV
jgi:hypothetical protein